MAQRLGCDERARDRGMADAGRLWTIAEAPGRPAPAAGPPQQALAPQVGPFLGGGAAVAAGEHPAAEVVDLAAAAGVREPQPLAVVEPFGAE